MSNFKVKVVTGTKLVDGVIEQVIREIPVVGDYTKRYDIGLDKMIEMTYCEIYLLIWLAERVDRDCSIETGARVRLQFINFMMRISKGKILYKDNTVIAALQKLRKLEFLLVPPSPAKRGWHWLNPLYFFRGDVDKRTGVVKDVFNSWYGNTNSKLYSKHNFGRELLTLEATQ